MLKQQEKIEQDKEKFLQHLEEFHGNVRHAGFKIGRKQPHSFVRYHKELDPEFAEKFDKIKEEANEILLDIHEEALLEHSINKKSLPAIMYFLKCQGKSRGWTEYKEFEGGTGNIVIKIVEEDALDGQKARVRIEAAEDVSEAGGNIQ